MGIYDRDYYRNAPRGGFGTFALLSVTTWLVILNVGIYVADMVLLRTDPASAYSENDGTAAGRAVEPPRRHRMRSQFDTWMPPPERIGYFSIDTALRHGQVWRVITFQFLHATPLHLAYNMLALLLFGPIVEGHFGPRRYLAFYLSCGIAGAVMYVVLWALHVVVTSGAMPMVGASAGVFGLLIGAARFAPDMEVPFVLIPMRVATLAWVMVAFAVLIVLGNGRNAGGEAGHIGGALWGLLVVQNQHWLNFIVPHRRQRRAGSAAHGRRRRVQKDWSKDMNR